MRTKDLYKLRTPSSGREKVVEASPEQIYIDQESGEEMEVVAKVLPIAPSQSELTWTVSHLRNCDCPREQLLQNDLSDCPYCNRRLGPPSS